MVITATKMAAVATPRSVSAAIEDAVGSCLGTVWSGPAARVDFRAVLDPLAAQGASDLADVEAIEVAVEELAGAGQDEPAVAAVAISRHWDGAAALSRRWKRRRDASRCAVGGTLSAWLMLSGQPGDSLRSARG